jgi:di/tricarboxylate transporter
VNTIAKRTVNTRPQTASIFFPAVIAWCEYVTVAPEQSKIKVFSRGIAFGSKTSIPLGGQMFPISIVGAKLAAKNAQKNAKKNITSDTINKITP